MGLVAQRVQGRGELVLHAGGAGQQVAVGVGVQRGQAGGAGQRVGRVGVAVKELDQVLGPGHEGVVDLLLREDRAHRHAAVGDALGHGHQVGRDAEGLRAERVAGAAEAGDDLIEDQQDAVLVADLAQPLQIALRRNQHAGGAGHRLDDDGGDGRGVVQRHEALQVVGKLGAVLGHADRERIARRVMRVADVVHAGQQAAEHLAVGHHAADRDAAEVHAVVAALAADEPGAARLAAHAVVGDGHLQGGLDRLGAGVGEEHAVQPGRSDGCQPFGQLEGLGVGHLEGRRKVQLGRLLLDGLHDAGPVVAGIDAPQAGDAVQHLAALVVAKEHAVGLSQQPRRLLELAVGRERHPVGIQLGNVSAHGGSQIDGKV
mmetsp:Transcript_6064/g.24216  ORF Transcript_6064/g.24216 Transcript_6064/m.24216 type:complete len:373 (+) Transcript_6064:1199-2317(+)